MNRSAICRALPGSAWVCGAALALACLAASSAALAGEMSAGAKALMKLDDDWSKAAVARDVDAVVSYYAEDAIAYPPGAPVANGRDAVRKVWAAGFADPSFNISWKTVHAGVARSGDLGFTAGTYEDSYKGADGKMVKETGKYVCTWKKQKNGAWKAIHDIWNTDAR